MLYCFLFFVFLRWGMRRLGCFAEFVVVLFVRREACLDVSDGVCRTGFSGIDSGDVEEDGDYDFDCDL